MIPAIWLGNFAIIYAYKMILLSKKKNYFLAGVVGIIVKVAIIFGIFNIIKAFGVFPEKLVTNLQTAMGATQAITATIGMFIAFVIYKIELKKTEKNN
jgi:predicted membrane-bound spermidine synthase